MDVIGCRPERLESVTYEAGAAHQTGRLGALKVMAALEELGIGVEGIREHDFGMDIFLHARNPALIDLGVFATGQIKAGSSYFSDEIRGPDKLLIGWWFRSDEQHLDYWRQTALPHVVVLHNPDSGKSYWRRVRPSEAERTGDDWRIAVPASQVIDREHRHVLLDDLIADSPSPSLEGTIWRRPQPLDPADVSWRLVLCAPRLVAPHRNAGFTHPLGPMAAAAMLVQHRTRDFEIVCDSHPEVPTLETAGTHRKWDWRFVHALARWLFHEDSAPLVTVTSESAKPANRAAAIVAAAVGLRYTDGAARALEFVATTTSRRRFAPIDRGWLDIHRARLYADLGDGGQAVAAATRARSQLALVSDPMATAIRGVAASVIWEEGAFGSRELEEVIRGSDNVFAWWRAQTLGWVGDELLLRDVEQWARAQDRQPMEDDAERGLASVTATSLFLGDSTAAHRFIGRYELLNAETADEAAAALDRLIVAGDTRGVELGVRSYADSALMEGITLTATRRRSAWWNRHSFRGLIEFATQAADLIDGPSATDLISELLVTALDESAPHREAAPRGIDVGFYALRAVAELLPASPATAHRNVARNLLASPDYAVPRRPAENLALRAVLQNLDWSQLSPGTRTQLLTLRAVQEDRDVKYVAQAKAAAAGDPGALTAIAELATRGDLRQLAVAAAEGYVPCESDAVATVEAVVRAVEQMRTESHTGTRYLGSGDPLHLLAWLCLVLREHARWEVVSTALADPELHGYQVAATLRYLAANSHRVPKAIRRDLGSAISRLDMTTDLALQEDHRGYALALRAHARLIHPKEYESTLRAWLTQSDPALTVAAAEAAAYGPTSFLSDRRAISTALRMSPDPAIRALGVAVALKRPAVIAGSEMLSSVNQEGRRFARQLATSLRALGRDADLVALQRLSRHPSATVRRTATASEAP